MKLRILSIALIIALALLPGISQASTDQDNACWGQATAVFAQTGEMGKHSSQQPTPRIGLQNLAQLLYDAGIIDEASMSALGAFVAAELGLSIDACMD
jgi:hypothetical protein